MYKSNTPVCQPQKPRSVVPLNYHENHIERRRKQGGYEEHGECSRCQRKKQRHKACYYVYTVDCFRLAGGSQNLFCGVLFKGKCFGGVGGHFVFPLFYSQFFVQSRFKGFRLKTFSTVIHFIFKLRLHDSADEKPYTKVIKHGIGRYFQRYKKCIRQEIIQNGEDNSRRKADCRGDLHGRACCRFFHSISYFSFMNFLSLSGMPPSSVM